MPLSAFSWPVSNNTTVDVDVDSITDEVRFGMGFRQIVPNGAQATPYVVNVEIGPIEPTETQALWDYLESAKGIPFPWTPIPPLPQVEMQWQVRRFGFKPGGGLIRFVTAVFERFPMP
jgi:phage-related protein